MNRPGHLYYNSDKDVFDALHNKKFGNRTISEQLKDRGILVSSEDSNEDLVEYASPLFLNYHDQMFISDTLNSRSLKKNFKSKTISANIPDEKDDKEEFLKKLSEDIKRDLEKDSNDSLDITRLNDGSYLITNSYTETDYSKSLMSQNLTKTSEVRIWRDGDEGIKIRGTEDKKTDLVFEKVQDIVNEVDDKASTFTIELSNILDSKARSEFFINLIKSMEGFDPIDVKSVSTSTINSPEASENGDITPHVNRMLLTGSSVIQSEQFNNLSKAGYYITRIVWSAVQKKSTGDKYDFVAEFKNNQSCSGFSYAPLRFYSRKDNGDFNISPNKLPDITISSLLSVIEETAIKVHKAVVEKYSSPSSSEDKDEDD